MLLSNAEIVAFFAIKKGITLRPLTFRGQKAIVLSPKPLRSAKNLIFALLDGRELL